MKTISAYLRAMLKPVHELCKFVGILFENYKFARRFMFFWAIWMVTDTYFWFKGAGVLSDNQRLVILAIFGLMSLMIGFYQWSRDKEG